MATETVGRPARVRRGGPARTSEGRRAEARLAFRLLIPAGIVLLVIIAYPVVRAIWLSLYSDNRFGTSQFIGLKNYIRAFTGTGSQAFWQAFSFTTLLTLVTMVFELVIGFGMALIMNRAFRGRGLVRASVLVPWAIPTAVSAQLWLWNFNPTLPHEPHLDREPLALLLGDRHRRRVEDGPVHRTARPGGTADHP